MQSQYVVHGFSASINPLLSFSWFTPRPVAGATVAAQAEVQAFCSGIKAQSAQTREAMGDASPTTPPEKIN